MEASDIFMTVSRTHDFGDFVTFFPTDRKLRDGKTSAVNFHLKVVLQNMSIEIWKLFDRMIRGKKSDEKRSPTKSERIPRTMIDGRRRVTEKQLQKMKRGRELKLKADICLLASSTADAETYYCEAQKYCRKFEDWMWFAGSLEGRAASMASLRRALSTWKKRKNLDKKNNLMSSSDMKQKKGTTFSYSKNNVPVTVGEALAKPEPSSIESLLKSATESYNKSEAYALWITTRLKLCRYLSEMPRRRGVLECSSHLTSMWSRVTSGSLKDVFEINDTVR